MRLLVLCALLAGCASTPKFDPTRRDREELEDCLQEQVDYYGDLCAEGVDTHPTLEEPFRTMLCGLQGVANCIGVREPTE